MAQALRRVMLLGAFELHSTNDAQSRDGLILGSRRQALGFVLETSREHIEQIISMARPVRFGLPLRALSGLGPSLVALGAELLRVELIPIPGQELRSMEEGRYVQGHLVVRSKARKLVRFPMTAAEAIQVAMSNGLNILAAQELLQLRVGPFLADAESAEAAAAAQAQDEKAFSKFLRQVSPEDFRRFFEKNLGEGPTASE